METPGTPWGPYLSIAMLCQPCTQVYCLHTHTHYVHRLHLRSQKVRCTQDSMDWFLWLVSHPHKTGRFDDHRLVEQHLVELACIWGKCDERMFHHPRLWRFSAVLIFLALCTWSLIWHNNDINVMIVNINFWHLTFESLFPLLIAINFRRGVRIHFFQLWKRLYAWRIFWYDIRVRVKYCKENLLFFEWAPLVFHHT